MKTPSFLEYQSQSWDEIQPHYQELQDIELTEDTLGEWMKKWSDLRKLEDERYARVQLAISQDTADEEAEREFLNFIEHIRPPIQVADQSLKEKLLESGFVPEGMKLALKKMRTEADIFREENLPLMTEESKLGTQYDKIVGAQTIDWQGEEITPVKAKSLLLTPDRETRRELWEKIHQRWLEDQKGINDLWVKFMGIRKNLAQNADFSDYRSYSWLQRLRLDYTPKDSKQFLDAIKDVVVPAATRVYERYQDRIGIDQVYPWDLSENRATISLPAIQAFETEEELINKGEVIFNKIDQVLGEYFKTMREKNLLDLMNRKDKAPGAFCTSFDTLGMPFILMNAVNKTDDLYTLFHETGHGFHVFEVSNLPYHHQWSSPMEFNEVASMAMELLAEPYIAKEMGGFLSSKDAARTRLENLEGSLLFWPYMAVVVAFQHWVYENQNQGSDPNACDEKWAELIDTYMPGINWEGYPEVKKTGWHRKLHIHHIPFYYIEYGLASLGAFQVWMNAQKDQAVALQQYREALALGGTVSLPELYRAAGVKLAFDAETLGSVVGVIEKTLLELEEKIS